MLNTNLLCNEVDVHIFLYIMHMLHTCDDTFFCIDVFNSTHLICYF